MQPIVVPANLRCNSPQQLSISIALSKNARGVVTTSNSIEHCCEVLCQRQLWFDATLMMAHALHKRPAVWWAMLVCNESSRYTSASLSNVFARVENWLKEPSLDNAYQVTSATMAFDADSPIHWLGLSVKWSMADFDIQHGNHVRAQNFLYATAVSAVIDLCAGLAHPMKSRAIFFTEALSRARDIAQGGSGR